MKVVALGGGGYIGSYLALRLAGEGHEVSVLDTDLSKIWKRLGDQPLPASMSVTRKDLRTMSEVDLAELCRGADLVIDLIAHATPALYVKTPLDVVELNYDENMRVVKMCTSLGTRLVQFSSCEVYGIALSPQQKFWEEESALMYGPIRETRWIYASAKQLLERMVHAYGEHRGLNYSIIRPFNFVGPEMDYLRGKEHDPVPRVFPQFLSSLLNDFPLTLVDGGKAHRTFTYIDDAIDGCMLVINNEQDRFTNQIVNVGTPDNGATIRELAHLMLERWELLTGNKGPDIRTESGTSFYGEGYADCNRRVPDASKLLEAGWKPKHSLTEAIDKTLQYYFSSS